jgi:hypothetical protein
MLDETKEIIQRELSIIYEVKDETIQVVAVIHGSR